MDQIVQGLIIGIVVTVVGGVIVLVIWRVLEPRLERFGKPRVDFKLTRESNGDWWLQRMRRGTAWALSAGVGAFSTADAWELSREAARHHGDLDRRAQIQVGRDGEQLWFTWVARDRRWYSKSVTLRAGEVEKLLPGIRAKRGKSASTV